jgi:hypothetical protein
VGRFVLVIVFVLESGQELVALLLRVITHRLEGSRFGAYQTNP